MIPNPREDTVRYVLIFAYDQCTSRIPPLAYVSTISGPATSLLTLLVTQTSVDPTSERSLGCFPISEITRELPDRRMFLLCMKYSPCENNTHINR